MEGLGKYISVWAFEFGNSDPTMVLMLAALAFLLLLVVVVALRTTIQRNQESDRTAALMARVEKLEGNITEFRGEMARLVQQFRSVTDSVRHEVQKVKKEIEDSGPGGGGSGSAPAGGGSLTGGGSPPSGGSAAASVEADDYNAQHVDTQVAATPVIAAKDNAPHMQATPEVASTISRGLTKTRKSLLGKLKSLFSAAPTVSATDLDELEEMLITADVGVQCTHAILEKAKQRALESGSVTHDEVQELVKSELRGSLIQLAPDHRLYRPSGSPMIVLVVGVNGVGKTTTTAKLAARWKSEGKKVLMVAADTFRAAAVQQLQEWGRRLDVTVISGPEDAKPSTVVFDGMVAAKSEGVDIVLIDTAGRLHTKSNLMQELEGIRNAVTKHFPQGPDETLLVVDGVSGQNALHQAREFNAAVALSGVVVTKLDGTPKGGIVVAIARELNVPVAFVGVGEKATDLLSFSASEFIEGLFEDGEGGELQPSIPLQSLATTSVVTPISIH